MKRLLLATVASAGLAIAATAYAQETQPVPTTPPITAPEPESETTAEEQAGTAVESTEAQTAVQAETQAPETQADGALAVPASASDVCAQRTTSVHFGARGSALSSENRHAIEHATDAASVCSLQTVTIVDSAEGRVSSRRAQAVRATLVSQGVPEDRITIAQDANADAEATSTGRLDIRMAFAGVANQAALQPTATSGRNAAAEPTSATTETVVAPAATAPETAPETAPTGPEAMPSSPETPPPAEPAPEPMPETPNT